MGGFRLRMLLVGVGGQGVMLVTRTISEAAIKAGYKILVAETHGQAVRGGSTSSHLTYGEDGINSPLIMKGTADIVLGFEPVETLRALPFLRWADGVVVYSVKSILPLTMRFGAEKYPPLDEVGRGIARCASKVFALDAVDLAKAAGSQRTVNTVLLGASYGAVNMGMPEGVLLDVLKGSVPPGTEDVNVRAFAIGKESVSSGRAA
jgi:indolepyruvate ferredoxin oxidoreductase beta subunit